MNESGRHNLSGTIVPDEIAHVGKTIVDGDFAQIRFIGDDEMRPSQRLAILEGLGRIEDEEHRAHFRSSLLRSTGLDSSLSLESRA